MQTGGIAEFPCEPFDPLLDAGVASCNFDPALCAGDVAPSASGTLHVMRLRTARQITVAYLCVILGTAGATFTSGQSKMALYSSGKALLGTTDDLATTWDGPAWTVTKAALGTPASVPAGAFYVTLWVNAATRPKFAYALGSSLSNGLLSVANSRFVTADTGLTTTAPASLGAFSASNVDFWAGVTES